MQYHKLLLYTSNNLGLLSQSFPNKNKQKRLKFKHFVNNIKYKENLKQIMSGPMQRSMQGTSQFVSFQSSMQKSMCGSSQKIPIDNASTINKMQRQKDMKAYRQIKGNKSIKQQDGEEEENQFLHVGKWNKQRQSDIRKSYEQQQNKIKEVPSSTRESKIKNEQNQLPSQPASSKWQKKKSYESASNRSQQSTQQNNKKLSQQANQYSEKQYKPVLTNKSPSKIKQEQKQIVEDEHLEDEQEVQDQQQQEQQDEEEEQQDQQQEQQQEEQQDQQQDQDQEDENQQQPQEEPQQEQEQQIQDKFATGQTNDQFQQSSQAMKTQTVNTSAMGRTPMISKWGKKKAPLETMTKYQQKQIKQQTGSNVYHSRLNSASNIQKQQEDQITEDIPPQNDEEWNRVQKVLLRLKLLLS